jgi:hypothetical protein
MGSILSRTAEYLALLPKSSLKRVLVTCLGTMRVHLCLHRVTSETPGASSLGETIISENELDSLLELLGCDVATSDSPQVTASFDDGYADAVLYVNARHARFPGVAWEFFVCPAKTRDRVGFRWDLDEGRGDDEAPLSIDQENGRKDLRDIADLERCRLATVEQLRSVSTLPRVTLGNHTNCHFALSALDFESCRRELQQSRRDFEELFGTSTKFAFPYGVPGMHFQPLHLEMLASEGYQTAFSVEPRPAVANRHGAIEVVPRLAIMGSWSAAKTASYLAITAVREWSRLLSTHFSRREPKCR